MYIYWLGESSFKIKTDQAALIIDPADKTTGLAQTALTAEIILVSQSLPTDLKRVQSPNPPAKSLVIQDPGEYETHDIFIYGLPGENNNILYLIKTEGLSLAHLGGLQQNLNSQSLELFEGADIVLIPVGNKGLLSGKQADQVISQIDPSIVIPMNYQISKLNIDREPANDFLSEMGVPDISPESSLYITRAKLPVEETKIVLLQC